MSKSASVIIGVLLAALSCGLLIYAIETSRSFTQIFISFGVVFFPVTFISSIRGKVLVFIFTFILIVGIYICYKQGWYDTTYGAALALLLGGAASVLKVSKAKRFSATDYKKEQKKKRDAQ